MMKIRFAILFCFCLLNLCLKAQETELTDRYDKYQQNNLHEKLFVHTDKAAYLTGEILWFKVYYVNAADHKPLSVSKVAYIEILDKNQVPVLQAKIALSNGTGNGSLYLPVNITNGTYKLRAYTNWMKNYGPESFFEKPINIVNPLRSPEETKPVTSAAYDIQFFPEGGNLVSGTENKVGFRMVNKHGNGVNLNGAIVDQTGDTVARFKPLKFGLGNFRFIPAKNKTYRAVVKTPERIIVTPLTVTADNYSMLVTNAGGTLNVKINGSTGNEELYLIAYSDSKVAVAQRAGYANGAATFIIDMSKLPAGVNHFTIFNSAKQPVCERAYFVRGEKKLTLSVSSLHQNFGTRAKVEMGFNAAVEGKPMAAMLSMSVYKVDSLQNGEDVDIQSYLSLSSNLKGNIESPQYYFDNVNSETDAALDNLMLTQGWSHFDWSASVNNSSPIKFLPEYNGHIITGKITDAFNNPKSSTVAYLGIPGKRVQMYPAISDTAGILKFNTKAFFGSAELVVQTNPLKDTTSHITIQSPFFERYANTTYPDLQLTNAAREQLANYSIGMQLQNVYTPTKMRQFYEAGVDSSAFYFTPYKTYKLDDFTRFTTMEEVLREYVSEAGIFKSQGRFHLRTLSENGIIGDDPLVLIDGVPVFNAGNLLAVDPLKIQKLDVVPARYFYGPTENTGIFSFTSYKGNSSGVEINPHAVVLDYEGMQLQRKFYSPVYDTPEEAKSRLPDFRNVLYWLPVADTGIDGKNIVTFYTGDRQGRYICVIEGITQNGEAGYTTTTFEVK